MITLEEFKIFIDSIAAVNKYTDDLNYLCGIDIVDSKMFQSWGILVDNYIKAVTVDEVAADLVSWYLFEADDDDKKSFELDEVQIDISKPEDFYQLMKSNGWWK